MTNYIPDLKIVQNILPGHGAKLHAAVSVESPEQSAPPLLGAGFVQLLVLDCDPVPQLKLHSPYPLQADHPPTTGDSAIRNVLSNNIYLCYGDTVKRISAFGSIYVFNLTLISCLASVGIT